MDNHSFFATARPAAFGLFSAAQCHCRFGITTSNAWLIIDFCYNPETDICAEPSLEVQSGHDQNADFPSASRITPETVAPFERALDIQARDEEDGGRRREYLDISSRLHEAFGLRVFVPLPLDWSNEPPRWEGNPHLWRKAVELRAPLFAATEGRWTNDYARPTVKIKQEHRSSATLAVYADCARTVRPQTSRSHRSEYTRQLFAQPILSSEYLFSGTCV